MSNLDNILNQILEDAKSESDQIIKEAEQKRDEEIKKLENQAHNEKIAILAKAETESQNLVEKMENSANLKARDQELSAKQEIIDKVFKLAKDKLKNIDEKTYLSIVQSALKTANLSDKATISLQQDKVEAFKRLGLNYKLSDEYVESGFKFYDGNSIMNNDFSGVVDFMKQDLENLIVQNLFEK